MSVDNVKPDDVKVEEGVKEESAPIAHKHENGDNSSSTLPEGAGVIKTAPDDIKPPPISDLFGADSPPPLKTELYQPPSRSPSPGPSRPPLNSRSSTSTRKKAAAVEHKPILINDLPTAWDEAHRSFVALDKCVYDTKGLGLSREQDDMMVCDCVYDKRNPDSDQCGLHSDCVNRAIFIECLAKECRAKDQCRNQRFTKQEYARLDIVQTEKKGFGLRAAEDMPSGTLVYEYIGEVVAEAAFRKRMQLYADEGIRHFYFMMLQKEEYIDATKKGGIGRFANHSCNPNSEVQKWVVGRRLKMGIFTKRAVVRGEEITFNYNVDRYGHDAQICYCGEPNCVGTIGGKTQTDIGGMGDLLIEALGIADDVESMEMKGNKKRKARQLDDIDYIPILKPIADAEVAQKVAAAMRQTMENSRVLSYLLQRIKITDDPVVHRQLMRMHGFSMMNMIFTDLADDQSLVASALEAMCQWKLQEKNKVEDSGIVEPVEQFAKSSDPRVSEAARRLLEYWSTLTVSYRIARKPKIPSLDEEDEATTTTIAEADSLPPSVSVEHRRPQTWENNVSLNFTAAPVIRRGPPIPSFARPRPPPPPPVLTPRASSKTASEKSRLDAIIAMAQQSASASSTPTRQRTITDSPGADSSPRGSQTPLESPAPPRPVEEIWAEEERRKEQEKERERRKRQRRQSEQSSERDDKRAKKLVGDLVVDVMSKHKQKMERHHFKSYAQQCTEILIEKEKKGKDPKEYAKFCRLTSLPEDKRKKIKTFVEEYTMKVLKRLEAKGKLLDPKGGSKPNGEVKVNGNGNGNGTSSHDPSATPGDSYTLATPDQVPGATPLSNGGSSSRTPVDSKQEENYADSDNDMDIDIDAELEDHTFNVVKT